MKLALVAGIALLASFYGAPYYFNHIQEVGGSTYANIVKMLTDYPEDTALQAALRDAFKDESIASSEWQTILGAYHKHHGTFEGVPYRPGIDEETLYPKAKHKGWLFNYIKGRDHERTL